MKNIIILLMVIAFCSCKSETKQEKLAGIYKAEAEKHWPSNHDPDTFIRQFVWLYKSDYVLQTTVNTEHQQNRISTYSDINFYLDGDSYVPYNKEIKGTFEFIKNNKPIEYKLADSFIESLRTKARRDSIAFKATLRGKMTDSVKILNELKP